MVCVGVYGFLLFFYFFIFSSHFRIFLCVFVLLLYFSPEEGFVVWRRTVPRFTRTEIDKAGGLERASFFYIR